ncbi:efflux RND transporter permease subunit [Shewanella sp. WXL01]|uniref:efflux RND transporter permease subunit n=1 Tax=Shewanella sp. WXL01 TaxID=2709721 RepID=UPI0014383DFE|nr:efflux RND transporter permease subunit [Shewanella sp. WXL01]NKF49376.1 efflux RND transporter permease subunit [Shewanella sp. WXL01]
MNLAEFAIRQRVFVVFFTVLATIAGIYSYFDLGKLEDPSFTVKTAVVVTLYPGASASEVEQLVTDTVETKLQEMGSLKTLRSLSKPGVSMIFVDLVSELPSDALPQQWDLLRRKVTDIKLLLPPEAQISVVQDEFSEVYGMLFAIHSQDAPSHQLKDYAKELQRRLKAVSGIKKIELHGVQNRVVHIDISDERIAESGLSAAQVINQLNSQNMPLDSGSFKMGIERLRVAQTGAFTDIEDIKNVMIKSGVGQLSTGLIRLGDISDIYYDYQKPALTQSRYNGEPAITLAVSPVNGINVVSLGDELTQIINDFQAELPVGVNISTIAFQPEEVHDSITTFINNLLESIAIVVVVLMLFMGWQSALIVGASLLLTILSTLIFMNFAGIDLQRVSVGSFILALGMLVDNAIVIADMFSSKLKQGKARLAAATESVGETALPLLGATLIAIMGASPVIFSTTDASEFAISVVQILASSMLLSWVIAMTFTPLMCWLFIKTPEQSDESKPSKFKTVFTRVITWTINNPKRTIASAALAVALTLVIAPLVKVNFIPTSDREMVFLDYWLPNGSQTEQASKDMLVIEKWLIARPEVESIASYIGASAPRFSVTVEPEPLDSSYGQILINTHDFQSIETLVSEGNQWLAQHFPQAQPRFRALKLATKDKFSIEVRYSGPDPKVLHELSSQAQQVLQQHPNTRYVRDDWRQESKVLVPIINQEKARLAGVNRADISLAIKRATDGFTVGQLRQEDTLLPIIMRSPNSSIDDMGDIPVRSLLGVHSVPLSHVVDGFEVRGEQSMLWRRDRVPTLTVQAGVHGETIGKVRNQISAQIEAIALPPGYTMEWGGEYADEQEAIDDILLQTPKAFLIMVIILVALFGAFKQPLIILTTVPLAAIGVCWSLLLLDKPFGFMALVGAIALSGMIIKNGIVLADQIELERQNGKSLDDAILDATLNRTMAITMGALTTALGMIPLLSDLLFDQMAATIIGGLVVATALTLLLMPALYKVSFNSQSTTRSQEQLNEQA